MQDAAGLPRFRPSCAADATVRSLPKSLNPSQQAAVVAAAVHPSTLIWGPPGTGKTQVAEEIMRQWSNTDAKVLASPWCHNLATSATKSNVDSMAER